MAKVTCVYAIFCIHKIILAALLTDDYKTVSGFVMQHSVCLVLSLFVSSFFILQICLYLVFAHPFYTRAENWIFLAYEVLIFLYMIVCMNYYLYKTFTKGTGKKCHFKWCWIWMAILSLLFWIMLRLYQGYIKTDTPYAVKKVAPVVIETQESIVDPYYRRRPYEDVIARKFRRDYFSPPPRRRDVIEYVDGPVD